MEDRYFYFSAKFNYFLIYSNKDFLFVKTKENTEVKHNIIFSNTRCAPKLEAIIDAITKICKKIS